MKKRKVTLHIVPDNEESPRSFNISVKVLRLSLTLVLLVIILLISSIYWFLPKALDYDRISQENEVLINERLKATRIINDYNRIRQMDTYIRDVLGVDIGLSGKYGIQTDSVNSENGGPEFNVNSLENIPTYTPVDGFITQQFNIGSHFSGDNHYGIDVASKLGEPIFAAADGFVIFSNWTYRYGNMVIISHGDTYYTMYAHNQRNTVNLHQIVRRGDLIAYLGNTGLSYGPHLHFEIWKNGIPVNPVEFIYTYKDKDVSLKK